MVQEIVRTGYINLDKEFGGFSKRELAIIASRPGMGKTAFMTNLAVNMVKANYRVAIFHLGEKQKDTIDKIACMTSGVNYFGYLHGELSEKEAFRFHRAKENFVSRKINHLFYINDDARTMSEIILSCAEQKIKYGLDAVFIDDLYGLRYFCEGGVSECVRLLNSLAEKLNIAVIAAAQAMRCGSKPPLLAHIREKIILKAADKILLLHRLDVFATYAEVMNGNVAKGATKLYVHEHCGNCFIISNLRFNANTFLFYEPEFNCLDDGEIPE